MVNILKYVDKFLKLLKTDRNTFFTYVLTLISIYLCVDRIVEVLIMCFTGIAVSYWGPFMYTFALACPVFAFLFSFASKFVKEDEGKLSFFYLYCTALYIISISAIVQWVNQIGWLAMFSVPNYSGIVTNFMDVIKPAFTALACYFPIVTFYPLFKKLYMWVNDTKDIRDSIFDYGGIDLSDKSKGWGPYTCEMFLCRDKESGKVIKTPEARRFESTLIMGVSGAGKTSMMFEPMIARDIERKYFFKEASKEMGYTALKTGLASLNCPYSNEYINDNFTLNMLIPTPGKEKVYKSYFEKLLYHFDGENSIYKNLGITYLAPDYESISRIESVAENFNIKYSIVDPSNPKQSIGLNPFALEDPIKTSIAISSIFKRIHTAEIAANTDGNVSITERAAVLTSSVQAIENVSLLLKEMYPRQHGNLLPTLEDLYKLLNNFDLVQVLSEEMKKDEFLVEKYPIQISYFEKNFYRNSPHRERLEKDITLALGVLENLLRYPGIKTILCNRSNNLNYDDALKNGEVILVCTRRGDLGSIVHRAFGLFFLLLMQHSVISRPGNEKTRIPHFLYIDEFPPFVCSATVDIFTLYRKYRVGTIISGQNLGQFGRKEGSEFRQTILGNCATKIVFGNNTPEDNEWWQKEFGEKREWKFKHTYHTDGRATKSGNPEYDEQYRDIEWAWKDNYKAGKINSLKFKAIIYKTRDLKGKMIVGAAKVDFLESKYKEKQKIKTYNFAKFTNSIMSEEDERKSKKKSKFDYSHISWGSNPNNPNDMDPIQYNTTDARVSFDDANAVKPITDNNYNNNK